MGGLLLQLICAISSVTITFNHLKLLANKKESVLVDNLLITKLKCSVSEALSSTSFIVVMSSGQTLPASNVMTKNI